VIVDASVAFKWVFREADSDAAAKLVDRHDLRAPGLLLAEIGNALWKKARRGEIDDRPALAAQLALVASLVTTTDESDVMPRALDMAIDLDHAIYDCIYLALAEREDDRLMSADVRFVAKVQQSKFAALIERLA
jgi:predicted nucleic acid-binding protein